MYQKIFLVCAVLAFTPALYAQTQTDSVKHNFVQLSATSSVDVAQDLLTISLSTARDGVDAAAVQTQLKQLLDTALKLAKSVEFPGQMDVRSGLFSLYPRYAKDGKISGWQGSAELLLEGRDFALISATAGKIQTLNISNVGFALSREQRLRVEIDTQEAAIASFKLKATQITQSFGFTAYDLLEITINSNSQGFNSQPRIRAMAAIDSRTAPVPVEAGSSTVSVTASGSVQMR